MVACAAVSSVPDRKSEGHRIHAFINVMKACGCTFDSQAIPTFQASGVFEFWEGEFKYEPGQIGIVGKVTLDHDFIALRTFVRMPRDEVRHHREELHLLFTANQVSYHFEPDAEAPETLVVRLSTFVYERAPRMEVVRTLLDMLSHASRELAHARQSGFRNYRPLIP